MQVETTVARDDAADEAGSSSGGAPQGDTAPAPGVTATTAGRSRARTLLQWVVYALPVVGFLAAGWVHRWITDDGFIYLRVVQQIRAGNGPVFNAGERVEVFTGTLWVGVLAVADLVTPIRLEWLAVLLGLGCGAAGIALAMAGARRLAGDHTGWFVPLGAVVFVAVTPVWVFATSGLETGLVFAWLGACLYVLARWATPPHVPLCLPTAALVGLGWLVRPELALFSAGFVALVVVAHWRDGRRRHSTALLAAAVALPAAYQLFRMGYYGSLVPNTAIAKEAGNAAWDRGWTYLRDFTDPYWLWVPALALTLGGYAPLLPRLHTRRARLVVVVFAAGGLLHAAYMVNVGGDYIHARLLLPGFFALCAPVAVIPATRRHLAALAVAPWALAATLTFRPPPWTDGFLANGTVLPQAAGNVTTDDFGWGEGGPRRSWYQGPGLYQQTGRQQHARLDIPVADDVTLPQGAFGGIGMPSYAIGTDFDVLDVLGLADTFTAHLDGTTAPGLAPHLLAGHQKQLPTVWIAARLTPPGARPDPEAFKTQTTSLLAPTTGDEYQEQVAWARAALHCPDIVRLDAAATAPLTPRRIAANLVRSVDNTRLRIPADPEQAYRELCGPDVPSQVNAVRNE